ncbi:MAG: restriction endonuclease subunit S, partial [Selenomonas sp.]|nr:restriction endonuclease subunit S [Selenomonas sp.]
IKLIQYVFGYATVKLMDVAEYSKDRINAMNTNARNYVGVDNLLQNRQGKTNAKYIPAEGNLTKYFKEDVLIGNIRPYLRKIWFANCFGGTNGDVLVIHSKNNIDVMLSKFMYYVLSDERFFIYDDNNSKGAKMPRGNKKVIMEYEFYLPTIEKQKSIISILDRFDTLCNDMSAGLPAEIEARQKQYEYYRDKLLSFKELSKIGRR